MEVTKDSSPNDGPTKETSANKFSDHPRIQVTEYTSLKSANNNHKRKPQQKRSYGSTYAKYPASGESDSCCSVSDEMSSNTSVSDEMSSNASVSDEMSSNASVTRKMNSRQFLIFVMIMLSSLISSFTVCLFPPFFPRLAEIKGATATDYGLIIGTNCLVSFLVTPLVGKHISFIGVKYSYCMGMFAGGVCCGLSGLLEFFKPGMLFIVCAVLIRIVHAVANALIVISTFTYTATEFPTAVAKIFSLTRCVINIAQLGGPTVGGILYQVGGYFCPFAILGACQVVLSLASIFIMPPPNWEEDDEDTCDHIPKKKKNSVSLFKIMSIPTIWFSFGALIIATMCNGFLSINLEPQVLRHFKFSPIYIGLLFGVKDGANSIASPFWGWMCDGKKKSVKPFLIVSSILVVASFFLVGAHTFLGIDFQLSVILLVMALCLNGAGIGGQQVAGIADALHEVSRAGYPASPATHGLVAGLWSSLSGAGRFVSRAGSGILVDMFGFDAVSSIACGLQVVVALCTFIYLVMCECSLAARNPGLQWNEVTIVEEGRRGDEKVVFTTNSSPSESLMTRSVYVGIPKNCSGHRMATRIANSMPHKKWTYTEPETYHSRSIR